MVFSFSITFDLKTPECFSRTPYAFRMPYQVLAVGWVNITTLYFDVYFDVISPWSILIACSRKFEKKHTSNKKHQKLPHRFSLIYHGIKFEDGWCLKEIGLDTSSFPDANRLQPQTQFP